MDDLIIPNTKKELVPFAEDAVGRIIDLEAKLASKTGLAEDRYNEIKRLNRAAGKQQKEIEELEQVLNLLRDITDATPTIPTWRTNRSSGGDKRGIPTLFLSDLHLGETVRPEEMSFYNAYNRDIAEQRLQHTIDTAIMISEEYISGLTFDGLCMPLGGDILAGDIHAELARTNADTVFDEIVHWVPILASAILKMHEVYGNVYIPCVVGNHDRNPANKRTPAKRRSKDALTWVIYHWLQDKLSDVEGIQFQITESMDLSYKLYDTTYLLTHGDQFSGGNGIAGIYSPVMKGHYKKQLQQVEMTDTFFDWLIMGHFHQYIFGNGVIVNGSMKGYDEYAVSKNFTPEEPKQAFWVTTPEKGVTMSMPIFCQSDDESWKNEASFESSMVQMSTKED